MMKNFILTVLLLVSLLGNTFAQYPILGDVQLPTISIGDCGKLNLSWTNTANAYEYEIKVYKGNGILVESFFTNTGSNITYPQGNNNYIPGNLGNVYFIIRAWNRSQTPNWVSQQFTTSNTINHNPFPAITVNISNISCGGFKATWNGPTSCDNATYKVTVSKIELGNPTSSFSGISIGKEFTINDVLPGSQYNVKVELNSSTTIQNVTAITGTSPTIIIPAQVPLPAAPILQSNCANINVSWQAPACAKSYYVVLYSSNTSPVAISSSNIDEFKTVEGVNNTSVNFTNKTQKKFYKAVVSIVSNGGSSPIASTERSSNELYYNIPVTGVSVSSPSTPSNNTCDAINVNWIKNCAPLYKIELRKYSSTFNYTVINSEIINSTPASIQNKSYNGLESGEYYKVAIQSVFEKAFGYDYGDIVITDLYQMPVKINSPANVRIVSQCGRMVTIAWDSPNDSRLIDYTFDISNSNSFSAGNFALSEFLTEVKDINTVQNTVTIKLNTFAPFKNRVVHFRIKAKNSNNSCNSNYAYLYNINLSDKEASLFMDFYEPFSEYEGTNNFATKYWGFTRPNVAAVSSNPCVDKVQLKVEMVNQDGSLFLPNLTNNAAVRWTGPQVLRNNITTAMASMGTNFSNYIQLNSGKTCNFNGIATTSNLQNQNTSFILGPEIKFGTNILSTGYHKITLLYWINGSNTPLEDSHIIKVVNSLQDFQMKFPEPNNAGTFSNFYANSFQNSYFYGPGFVCRPYNNLILAQSNVPSVNTVPYTSWDEVYTPNVSIIFSKANTAEEFYNTNMVIGEKVLTLNEFNELRNGTLNLITLYNSLNLVANVNFIGIKTGFAYGTTPINGGQTELNYMTKIMSFGYTAKPINLELVSKCANDIRIKWTGNGNASGTIYMLSIGRNYNPTTKEISNFATAGSGTNSITFNNHEISSTTFQTILNAPFENYYISVKAKNGSGCISEASEYIIVKTNEKPIRVNYNPFLSEGLTVNACLNGSIKPNLEMDACVTDLKLEVENSLDIGNKWIGNWETKTQFMNKINSTNTPASLHPYHFETGSLQRYINESSTNPISLWFGGYDGFGAYGSTGNLFKVFNGYDMPYNVKFKYKINSNPASEEISNSLKIKYPNYPIRVQNQNGNLLSGNNNYPVPRIAGSTPVITFYSNYRNISINAENSTSSCIAFANLEFSNSGTFNNSNLLNPPSYPGNVFSILRSSSGLDIIGIANGIGFSTFPIYMRISYFSGDNSTTPLSAVYLINYNPINMYPNANIAYESESQIGHNNFVLENDLNKVYQYDPTNGFYVNNGNVLIPDFQSTLIPISDFYGFAGANSTLSLFQWDAEDLHPSLRGVNYHTTWDKINLFVSPLSETNLDLCEVLNQTNYNGLCKENTLIEIDSIVYPINTFGNHVDSGTKTIKSLLMDIGQFDIGQDNEFIIQQSKINSYCSNTYGKGWRLPTSSEIGKYDDIPVANLTTNPGYYENGTGSIWTSTFWQKGNSSWDAISYPNNTDIYLNNSYYTTKNLVRCVYEAK